MYVGEPRVTPEKGDIHPLLMGEKGGMYMLQTCATIPQTSYRHC